MNPFQLNNYPKPNSMIFQWYVYANNLITRKLLPTFSVCWSQLLSLCCQLFLRYLHIQPICHSFPAAHRFYQRVWMPWATTVVAAPILKLWPEYFLQLIPTLCSTTCRLDTCLWHVKGRLSSNQNSGPGLGPLSCFCSNCAKWLPVTWCMHPSNQCSPNPSTPFGTQYSSPLLPYIHSDYLVNLHL